MEELLCNGRNVYIKNKKPQSFERIEIKDGMIYIEGREVLLDEEIYACLYYDKLKNITFIVRGTEIYTITFLFEDEKKFSAFLDAIDKEMPNIMVSEQNKKINGYASALVAKLKEGIETEIFDNKEEEDIACCPVCGMQCDPNIPYCMECGASV